MTAHSGQREAIIGLTVHEVVAKLGLGTTGSARTAVARLGLGWRDHRVYDPTAERRARIAAVVRTDKPTTCCFLCGSRDWCRHNPFPEPPFAFPATPLGGGAHHASALSPGATA